MTLTANPKHPRKQLQQQERYHPLFISGGAVKWKPYYYNKSKHTAHTKYGNVHDSAGIGSGLNITLTGGTGFSVASVIDSPRKKSDDGYNEYLMYPAPYPWWKKILWGCLGVAIGVIIGVLGLFWYAGRQHDKISN